MRCGGAAFLAEVNPLPDTSRIIAAIADSLFLQCRLDRLELHRALAGFGGVSKIAVHDNAIALAASAVRISRIDGGISRFRLPLRRHGKSARGRRPMPCAVRKQMHGRRLTCACDAEQEGSAGAEFDGEWDDPHSSTAGISRSRRSRCMCLRR